MSRSLLTIANGRNGVSSSKNGVPIPLSRAQLRLWFIDQLNDGSSEYNGTSGSHLKGRLDYALVQRVINTIIERHESLRTRFTAIDGTPEQIIDPALNVDVPVYDWSGLAERSQETKLSDLISNEAAAAFALSKGPLLRVKLLKVKAEEHILLATFHHIVFDAWSQANFLREFAMLYQAFYEGHTNPLTPLSVQYADYAIWENERLASEDLRESIGYWKQQLNGIPECLALSTDRPRPALQTYVAETFTLKISDDVIANLRRWNNENGVTMYMSALTAFAVELWAYSGQDDVVIGATFANRGDRTLEPLIGFLVDTLPIRVRIRPETTFRRLMSEVRRTTLGAYQHHQIPFDRIVEELRPRRRLDMNPIVQVLFTFQNVPKGPPVPTGPIQMEPLPDQPRRVRFDLEVHALEQCDSLDVSWVFNCDLFDRVRIELMAKHYHKVLKTLVSDPDKSLNHLLLPEMPFVSPPPPTTWDG